MSKKNKTLKRKIVKLKANAEKSKIEKMRYKNSFGVMSNGLDSVRTQLRIAGADMQAKDNVIRIRDAKIKAMEAQAVKNHKTFQRLVRDYNRSLELINSLTTDMKIQQG